ncbi:MAG: ABC transporter ATP-binding protein [Myxococcota bacterium]|nr:ABC transporter ATP-binding protein [Myxococcota bacterium]
MLDLHGVCAPYGLNAPVDLTIDKGTMTAIIGSNGAGKTTLLKLLVGHLDALDGQVSLNGDDLSTLSHRARAKRIAYLPQFEDRPSGFTVEDLVQLGRFPYRRLWGGGSSEHENAVTDAMAALEVAAWRHRRLDTLSGGEYQRVRLARCLAQQARILVLDEPVAHLDLSRGQRLLQRLHSLCESDGLTVFVALHDLNLASVFFRRLVALKAGSIVIDDRPEDVLTPEGLRTVFDSGLEVVCHPQSGVPQVLPRAPRKE